MVKSYKRAFKTMTLAVAFFCQKTMCHKKDTEIILWTGCFGGYITFANLCRIKLNTIKWCKVGNTKEQDKQKYLIQIWHLITVPFYWPWYNVGYFLFKKCNSTFIHMLHKHYIIHMNLVHIIKFFPPCRQCSPGSINILPIYCVF